MLFYLYYSKYRIIRWWIVFFPRFNYNTSQRTTNGGGSIGNCRKDKGKNLIKRQKISITGQVQGVGFRPAVYRLAGSLGLTGIVYNDTKGVMVELQGEIDNIGEFLARLQSGPDKPPLAKITTCDVVDIQESNPKPNLSSRWAILTGHRCHR